MKKHLFTAIAATLIFALCSCGDKSQTTDDTKYQSLPENVTVENQAEAEESIAEEQIQKPQQELNYTNKLTGEKTQKNLESVRPIAVMINNLYEALPQMSVSEADIMYEVLEEGGITRLLCLYSDYENLGEIGSVRSARDYYIDLADAHDAVYVHAGRSTYADTALNQRKTNNIDGLYSSAFYRSRDRLQTKAYEHTLMTTGAALWSEIASKGYRSTSDKQCPLIFNENYTLGESSASHIEIPFSIGYKKNPYAISFFDYDSGTGTYLKGHFGQAHIDGDDGEQLSFKNVITLTCPMNQIAGDALGCIQVHFVGSGTGTYSVGGTTRDIVWKKESRQSPYILFESDGVTALEIAQGKSYIALVPSGTKLTVN